MAGRYELTREQALAELSHANTYRLVAISQGNPLYRALNGVLVDGSLYFHSNPRGSKHEAVGGAGLVAVDEVVTQIPSYFVDPDLACPATTYYRSVHAHGELFAVESTTEKAELLQAFMEKYQPEGGYIPLTDARYQRTLDALLVFGLRIERLSGRAKLGQNRAPEELDRLLNAMWRRGEQTDPDAIEQILAANPRQTVPSFLRGPGSVRLCCRLGADDAQAAVALTESEYWQQGFEPATIRDSHLGTRVWVGAKLGDRLVATARALSDGAKLAYIADVVVAPELRARGVGRALVRLLLDHPAVRRTKKVRLHTANGMEFYAKFGFRVSAGPVQGPGLEYFEMQRDAP